MSGDVRRVDRQRKGWAPVSFTTSLLTITVRNIRHTDSTLNEQSMTSFAISNKRQSGAQGRELHNVRGSDGSRGPLRCRCNAAAQSQAQSAISARLGQGDKCRGRKGGARSRRYNNIEKRAAQVSIKVNERVCRNTKRDRVIQVRRDRKDVGLGEAQSELQREVRFRNI